MDQDFEQMLEVIRVLNEDVGSLKETLSEMLAIMVEMNETIQEAMR